MVFYILYILYIFYIFHIFYIFYIFYMLWATQPNSFLVSIYLATSIPNAPPVWPSPWNSPRKKSRSLIFIFTFFTWLFSPLATNMGPYGPVWTRMDPYIILYCFYMIYTLFLHCFYMILDGFIYNFDICRHLRKLILHICYHILRTFQGSFL